MTTNLQGHSEGSEPQAQLLLTNDDGIDAPGLHALWQAAEPLGRIAIVAPNRPWSNLSHAVTTHEPIQIRQESGSRWAVSGSPADCVRLALHHLVPDAGWVLSGINRGGNLGTDIFHSGTVAAAREAVSRGRPAIAISHYVSRGRELDWNQAARWANRVLRELLKRRWEPGTLWNVNLPHPEPGAPEPELVDCTLDPSPLPLSYRLEGDQATYDGVYQSRPRQPGSDVDRCFRGQITITRLWVPERQDRPL